MHKDEKTMEALKRFDRDFYDFLSERPALIGIIAQNYAVYLCDKYGEKKEN